MKAIATMLTIFGAVMLMTVMAKGIEFIWGML